jgi:hypothetical protein
MRPAARALSFASDRNESVGAAVGHVIFALMALAATIAIAMAGPWPL